MDRMYGQNKWINYVKYENLDKLYGFMKKIWSSIESARLQDNLISVTLVLVLDDKTKLRDAL